MVLQDSYRDGHLMSYCTTKVTETKKINTVICVVPVFIFHVFIVNVGSERDRVNETVLHKALYDKHRVVRP